MIGKWNKRIPVTLARSDVREIKRRKRPHQSLSEWIGDVVRQFLAGLDTKE